MFLYHYLLKETEYLGKNIVLLWPARGFKKSQSNQNIFPLEHILQLKEEKV